MDLPSAALLGSAVGNQFGVYDAALQGLQQEYQEYQAQAEAQIKQQSDYIDELKAFAERQQERLQQQLLRIRAHEEDAARLSADNAQLQQQLRQATADLGNQQSRALQLSAYQEETRFKSAIMGLEEPRRLNQKETEVCYYRSLNQHLQSQVLQLQAQNKARVLEIQQGRAEAQRMGDELMSATAALQVSRDAELREMLYKALTIIHALAAPFDFGSEEFQMALKNAVVTDSYQAPTAPVEGRANLDELAVGYLARGLYLLGSQKEYDNKAWRQDPKNNWEVNQNFESFESLTAKINIIRLEHEILKSSFDDAKLRADMAESRVARLQSENKQLKEMLDACQTVIGDIKQQEERLREENSRAFAQQCKQLAEATAQLKHKVQQTAEMQRNNAEIMRNVVRLSDDKKTQESLEFVVATIRDQFGASDVGALREELASLRHQLGLSRPEVQLVDLTPLLEQQARQSGSFESVSAEFKRMQEQNALLQEELGKRDEIIGLLLARSSIAPAATPPGQQLAQLADAFIRQAKATEFYKQFVVRDVCLNESLVVLQQGNQIRRLSEELERSRQSRGQALQVAISKDLQVSCVAEQIPDPRGRDAVTFLAEYVNHLAQQLSQARHDSASELVSLTTKQAQQAAQLQTQFDSLQAIMQKLAPQLDRLTEMVGLSERIRQHIPEWARLCELRREQTERIDEAQKNIAAFTAQQQARALQSVPAPKLAQAESTLPQVVQLFDRFSRQLLELGKAAGDDQQEAQRFVEQSRCLEKQKLASLQAAVRQLEKQLRCKVQELSNVRRCYVQLRESGRNEASALKRSNLALTASLQQAEQRSTARAGPGDGGADILKAMSASLRK